MSNWFAVATIGSIAWMVTIVNTETKFNVNNIKTAAFSLLSYVLF